MACLSVFKEDAKIPVVCANPIYLDSSSKIQSDAILGFDVLDVDASTLKRMIGALQIFALESQAFWGMLTSLEPGAALFGKPALRGRLIVKSILSEHESTTAN
jgi:hypothetical protein